MAWNEHLTYLEAVGSSRSRPVLGIIEYYTRMFNRSTGSDSGSSTNSNDAPVGLLESVLASTSIAIAPSYPVPASSVAASSTSSRPSNWWLLDRGYSTTRIGVSAHTAAAAASSIVARSVGTSSGRPSISSTIRDLLGSTSSLSSSHRCSLQFDLEAPIVEVLEEAEGGPASGFPTLPEEDETTIGERGTYSAGDANEIAGLHTVIQRDPLLQIPGIKLRGRSSINSLSTIESNVSGVGGWDYPSQIMNSPVTDVEDEQGLPELNVTLKLTTRHTPENDSLVCAKAHSPLSMLAKLRPEILDNIMGNFDSPTEITNLQMVCKEWYHLLRCPKSEIYHTYIRQNYPHGRPGPGDAQCYRTYEDLVRIVKQDNAILKGQIYTPIEVKLRMSSVLLRYHAGYACFIQAKHGDDISSGQEVLIYNLQRTKHPTVFTCGDCSTIISATLGGGQQSGIQLVYCEVDEKLGASISCHKLPDREQNWRTTIPSKLALCAKTPILLQTNGFTTVLVVKNRILAWGKDGHFIGEQLLHQEQARRSEMRAGNVYLSESKVYLLAWDPLGPPWITVFAIHNLEPLHGFPLGVENIQQASGIYTDEKLYLALASPKSGSGDNFFSTWKLFCLYDKSPNRVEEIHDFPKFDSISHSRLVYYPHQKTTYVVWQTDFRQRDARSWLGFANSSTKEIKCLRPQLGYLGRLLLEEDCSMQAPLQGDNEYLVWCAQGKMKVCRFNFDQRDDDSPTQS